MTVLDGDSLDVLVRLLWELHSQLDLFFHQILRTSSTRLLQASLRRIFLMQDEAPEAGWRLTEAVEGFCVAVEALEVQSPLDPLEGKADHLLWAHIPWE